MAERRWRFCSAPGCGERVVRGRCAAHAREYNAARNSAPDRSLYHEPKFRRRRAAFLKRPENLLCVWCRQEGRTTASVAVDHDPPHRGNREAFYDESTWRASCTSCNSTRANVARRRERYDRTGGR